MSPESNLTKVSIRELMDLEPREVVVLKAVG